MTLKQQRSHLGPLFLMALLWTWIACTIRAEAAEFPASLAIVHTNDGWGMLNAARTGTIFKSTSLPPGIERLGGMARRAYVVQELRRHYGDRLLLLEAGSILGPFLDSFLDRGQTVVAAMNEMGYQAWTLSNSDFAFGLVTLRQRMQEARFPVLSANVVVLATGELLAKDYTILSVGGLRVAVLGLSSDTTPRSVPPEAVEGLVFRDPIATARALVPRIQATENPDLIVALANLGPEKEAALLNLVDVVVGGLADSPIFPLGLVHYQQAINGRYTLHAGSAGLFIGVAELALSGPQQIALLEPTVVPLDADLYPDEVVAAGVPAVQQLVNETNRRIRAGGFREVVGHLDEPLFQGPRHLLPLILEVMRARAQAEVAVLNYDFAANSESVNSPEKAVTYDQVYAQIPWYYDLVHVTLTGAQLQRLYQVTSSLSGRSRLWQVGLSAGPDGRLQVNGRPLEERSSYSVATSSYLAEGHESSYGLLARGRQHTSFRRSIRQVLIDHLWKKEQRGETVSMKDFPDYYFQTFWKPALAFSIDTLPTIVDVPPQRYKDLVWRQDQNSIQWGGSLGLGLRGLWGPNDLHTGFTLNYRQSNFLNGRFSVSSDSVAYFLKYRHMTVPTLLIPYAQMRIESVLVYRDLSAPRFLLGKWTVGVEHRFGPFSSREGLELRHQLLDNRDPWRLGPVWRISLEDTLGDFLEIGIAFDWLGSFNWARDGLTTEIDAYLRIPITDLFSFRYRLQAFQNTKVGPWAVKNSGGISLGIDGGWVW